MTNRQAFLSSVLVVVTILMFYVVGTLYLPPELHYNFQKIFIPVAAVFIVFELIRAFISTNYQRSVLAYLKQMTHPEQRVLDEVPAGNPIFEFYTLVIQLLDKFATSTQDETSANQNLITALKGLQEEYDSSESCANSFLQELIRFHPEAELYLFLIGNQKIYRLASLNGETPQGDSSKANPFSILTDFSGKAYQEGTPLISNDFRSDPNLGQFLSTENPNIPIYGALFPLKTEGQVRGFLWIRDSVQTLDSIKEQMGSYLVMVNLLAAKLIASTPDYTLPFAQKALIYPHFETQARNFFEHSKVQSSNFTIILIFAKWFESADEHAAFILEQIKQRLPAPSIYAREDQLYYIAIDGHQRQEIMLASARLLDRLVKYASIEHGDKPIGEINFGIFLDQVSENSPNFRECLKQAHDLLKESIASGPNQLRISKEAGENHEQSA